MNSLAPILIKSSIIFSVLYIIFWLAFKNKTFHKLNRAILLSILFFSVTIPLLELKTDDYFFSNKVYAFEIGDFDNFIENVANDQLAQKSIKLDLYSILKQIYLCGALLFLVRFILYLHTIFLLRLRNNAHTFGGITFIYTKNNLPPFSFFFWVFLPEDEFKSVKNHPIIEHERSHAILWHSFDLLLTEFFSIFLWFVPFVYSFKNSIKSVHEYQADSYVLTNSIHKVDYLDLLAANTEKYALIGLSNNFYCLTLKNRIIMITKNRSSNLNKLQYLIWVPAIVFLTLACAKNDKSSQITPGFANHITTKIANSSSPTFIQPIKAKQCESSSGFGMRMHPIKKVKMMHNAIDYKAASGIPVMASADGVVIKKEFIEGGYGNLLAIEHSNGFVTVYAQLSLFKTEIGNRVKQGEIIGLVGSSGISTGPHLHFEIRKNGEFVNPADFIYP